MHLNAYVGAIGDVHISTEKTSKMAIPQSGSELPNLKIEIENDLDDAMETDDGENNGDDKASKGEDPEEGEISDSKEGEVAKKSASRSAFGAPAAAGSIGEWGRRYKNKGGEFATGVGIFTKEEQSKLDERAKRFGLEPSDLKPLAEVQLKTLYQSLGVPQKEETEKHFRLNALHMRGTENMSTQDIFQYFKDFGPASIEWINDYSCNVIWLDNVSAARAILGLSKEIKGLKDFHANADPFLKEKESDKENEKEDSVMPMQEMDGESEENKPLSAKSHGEMIIDSEAVDVSDIPIPIPPGKWRVGAPFAEAKCILLRFATRTDKKQPQAEKMSEYYKKYGNPNYGGIKGLITNSRKRRYRQHFSPKVFEDDQGDARDFKEAVPEDGKNPWGNLAKSWSKLDKKHGHTRPEPNDRGSPPPIQRELMMEEPRGGSVFDRIKTRASTPTESDSSSSESSSSNTSNDSSEWTRKSKMPRMRMYADEEAIRIERRKAHVQAQTRRKQSREHRRDSRSSDRNRRSESYRSKRSRDWRSSRYSEERESRSRSGHSSRSDLRSKLGKGRASTSSTVWDRLKKTNSWEQEDSSSAEDTPTTIKFEGGDLRSKLNLKKTMRKHNLPMQKSPLRIEIDNDEYYKLIGSDQD